jgi:hypothetical protein
MMVSAGENVVGRTSNRMSTPRMRKAPRPNMRPRLKSPLLRIGSIASRSIIESFTQLASVRATWGLDRNRSSTTRALCGTPARWVLRHQVSQKRDTPIAYEDQPCGASRGPVSRMLAWEPPKSSQLRHVRGSDEVAKKRQTKSRKGRCWTCWSPRRFCLIKAAAA